jgi:hypothetical protein
MAQSFQGANSAATWAWEAEYLFENAERAVWKRNRSREQQAPQCRRQQYSTDGQDLGSPVFDRMTYRLRILSVIADWNAPCSVLPGSLASSSDFSDQCSMAIEEATKF